MRAVFAYLTSAPAPCLDNLYNDHDDLVFAVGNARAPVPGDLAISEIHYNPGGSEPYEEWVEIVNRSGAALEIEGLELASSAERRTIATELVLASGARAVLCRDAARGPAGCIAYGPLWLRNGGDEVSIHHSGAELDRVAYGTGAPWPAGSNGVSIELSELHLDPAANDAGRHWCHAVSTFGADLGTPGAPNDCRFTRVPGTGDLVITEIHANPSGPEPASEWFEIANVTADPILLDGVVVASGTSQSALAPGSVVPPGARAVLCRSTIDGPTGCLVYGSVRLNNTGADDVSLRLDGATIDQVAYDGTWPVFTDGISLELSESSVDTASNDDSTSWCAAGSSPGAVNGCP